MRYTLYLIFGVALLAGGWWYLNTHNSVAVVTDTQTGAVAGASATTTTGETGTPSTAAVPPAGTQLVVNPSGTRVDAEIIATSAPPPAGYIPYTNTTYGFTFYHSPQSIVKEYDEGAGAMTVTLENFEKNRGMQVFIVPYGEATISEERFHMDVPSGVRTNVENTSVDGVKAVTFNSSDAFLGPTREIWVIRGGYLYEITTFSGVGVWFTPIIQSWRFD